MLAGVKYLFALPAGNGSCWIINGLIVPGDLAATPGAPYIRCNLPFAPGTQPVHDPVVNQDGVPDSAGIAAEGAFGSVTGGAPDVEPKVLPIGSSLTVAHMTCDVLDVDAVRCNAQTGEFVFADGALTIVRSEPSPYIAAGAGKVCGPVSTRNGKTYPAVILAGKSDCPVAVAVLQKYMDLPGDPDAGNTQVQQFDGFTCFAPTAASAGESGVGADCSSSTSRYILPFESN